MRGVQLFKRVEKRGQPFYLIELKLYLISKSRAKALDLREERGVRISQRRGPLGRRILSLVLVLVLVRVFIFVFIYIRVLVIVSVSVLVPVPVPVPVPIPVLALVLGLVLVLVLVPD